MKTAESVTEGHPDKVCDQIADALLDEYLRRDPQSRVALEVCGSHGMLMIGGEVTSQADVDLDALAKLVYKQIGYDDDLEAFVNIELQSGEIAEGIEAGGAGDQGIVYGYATVETPSFMPLPIAHAHALASRLADLRKHDPSFAWLRPDGKTQVTTDYGRVVSVVVSTQHAPDIAPEDITARIREGVIGPVIGDLDGVDIHINPAGRFVAGGFTSDTGLTGRKLMVDTYGGIIPHGGGSFSGKDATKIHRSAAYMARFAAKNLVAAGHAKKCLISAAYAIGKAEPVMLTARSEDGRDLSALLRQHFDFHPQAIVERFDLRKPIFRASASYGHFGREQFPWERLIKLS